MNWDNEEWGFESGYTLQPGFGIITPEYERCPSKSNFYEEDAPIYWHGRKFDKDSLPDESKEYRRP